MWLFAFAFYDLFKKKIQGQLGDIKCLDPYLYGGNGTLGGGGNTLLHATHVSGQSGLVTDSRGDTTQQGRHLGTGLGESKQDRVVRCSTGFYYTDFFEN